MEWKTVKKRNRKKTGSADKQPVKITPKARTKSPRKVPEGVTETVRRGADELPLPHTSRASMVNITLKDRSDKSYAEVLVATKDNVPLAEVDIKAAGMRKTMTEGVVRGVFEDQKRK
jgi:hypothetical protein